MTNLHSPWAYVQGNAQNSLCGEIRDNRGHLIACRAVVTDEDKALMHCLSAAADMLQALREILAGSTISGRWLDASGCECEEGEEGAVFVSYNSEEQDQWIWSVAETAERAIAKAEGRANG